MTNKQMINKAEQVEAMVALKDDFVWVFITKKEARYLEKINADNGGDQLDFEFGTDEDSGSLYISRAV